MLSQRTIEALFLTNFSDACFRATRAVAQMADDMELALTLLYAHDPRSETPKAAEDKLRSFFPEADRYRTCRRVLMEGDVVSAVADLRARRRVDLVIAPVADRFRWPRVFHNSVRARLFNDLGLTMWTTGRGICAPRLGAPVKNVACVLDGGSGHDGHIEAAASYADKVGATLHLLHVMPSVDEGALFGPSTMLTEAEIDARVSGLLTRVRARTEVHIAPGTRCGELRRLIERCDTDLLFLEERRALDDGRVVSGLSRLVDVVECPTVCVRRA